MKNKNENKIYYVYVYLDPRQLGGTYDKYIFSHKPFYVGKGKGNRYLEHWTKIKNKRNVKNSEKNNILKDLLNENLEPKILKIKNNLVERDALLIESEIIKYIGLSNLTNLTNGGLHYQEGYKHTKETKKKLSKSSSGKVIKKFILIDPNGKTYENVSLSSFCKEHKLNYHKMRKFVNTGKIKIIGKNPKKETLNCNDWEIKRKDKEIKFNYIIITPDNKKYYVYKLTFFCEEHNLDYRTLRLNRNNGKIKIKNKTLSNIKTLNCDGWEIINIKNDNICNIKKSKSKIKYKIISPKNTEFYINNLKTFCKEKSLNERTFRTFFNKGKIKMTIKKSYGQNILNCIGWEIKTI